MVLDRRDALRALGIGLGAGLAGCLGNGPGDDTPDDGEVVATETVQLGTNLATLDHGDGPAASAVVCDDPDRTDAALAALAGVEADLESFLEATEYDTDVLVLVTVAGPDTCHDAVAISDVESSDGAIAATATTDPSDADACGDAVTAATALLRARFEGAPATEVALSVTDGFGEVGTVRASASDLLAPPISEMPGVVRPDGDPPAVPAALTCDREGVDRATNWVNDPPWGDVTADGDPRWALRADRATAALGGSVTVSLTNVAETELATGNRHKVALERYTEAGWQGVRVHPEGEPLEYTDEAVSHGPGEGFDWTLSLDEHLFDDHAHADRASVCPDLGPGRYRFTVFEPGVAVAFDVVE
jgi:hypothetical protein